MECDHCGWIAIDPNPEGFYFDGAGGECQHCWFPGQVSCDSESDPYWVMDDEPGSRCRLPDCAECRGLPEENADLEDKLDYALGD
jgi:hypothetical protein